MRTLNNNKRLDNSSGIGQDNPNKAMQPASETKKTPWHLRFAPGAILRIVSKASSLGVSLVQTVRQRLNQWNWRQKTSL